MTCHSAVLIVTLQNCILESNHGRYSRCSPAPRSKPNPRNCRAKPTVWLATHDHPIHTMRASFCTTMSAKYSSTGLENHEFSRREQSDSLNMPTTSSSCGETKVINADANVRAREALAKAKLSRKFRRLPVDSSSAFRAGPVDAAAASAVLRGHNAAVRTIQDVHQETELVHNFTKPSEEAFEKIQESYKSAGTKREVHNAGGDVTDWDSFVDWKVMEHQDYETMPDDQFERLSKKLHIEERWRTAVSYLMSIGLHTKELEKVLINCEELFRRPVAKIVTRVDYLQSELGFDGTELCKLIDKEPKILLQRNRHSVPRCRYLRQLGIPAESLPTIIRKQPQILQLSVSRGLGPRVDFLKRELRIPEIEIPKLIERNPAVLTLSVEKQIKPRIAYFKKLGIPDDGLVKMIVRHPQLLHYSFEGLEERISFLASIGMTEQEMVHTITRLSQIFSLSVTDSLKPKFAYLTEELGGDVQTCVKFPAYFSLSLEKRIRPRHTYLQQLHISPDPFPMRFLSEKDEAFAARTSRSLEDYISFKVRILTFLSDSSATCTNTFSHPTLKLAPSLFYSFTIGSYDSHIQAREGTSKGTGYKRTSSRTKLAGHKA